MRDIDKALRGDHEAAKRLTEAGVLLPCPHCGGAVKLMAIAGDPYQPTYEVDIANITDASDDICYVECKTCGTGWNKQIRLFSFPKDTILAWNTRAAIEMQEGME